MNPSLSSYYYVVIGLGLTGLSCIRFLKRRGFSVIVMDTRISPPSLEKCREAFPDLPFYGGSDWPQPILNQATHIIVSPGISVRYPPLLQAQKAGVELIGDVELFARFNKVPVVGITGANGKSTVTTLVGEMARFAGKKVAVVGNIGTPVLDLFEDQQTVYDLVVMELSSFQLETTHSLKPLVSTVLNITPDHLDRYASMDDYVKAKHRIYQDAMHVVINQQDPLSKSEAIPSEVARTFFTVDIPEKNSFGVRYHNKAAWLAYEEERWLPANALKIRGQHNIANALSALALGKAAGLEKTACLEALQQFNGLPHRCEWVADRNGITWINDSKGTNVGACQAALQGLGGQMQGKIVLLLGGEGKGADFSPLFSLVARYCRALILIGKDARLIEQALKPAVEGQAYFACDMKEAVQLAARAAKAGDIVLLSPACASLDQYRDFAHRGEVFTQAVQNDA